MVSAARAAVLVLLGLALRVGGLGFVSIARLSVQNEVVVRTGHTNREPGHASVSSPKARTRKPLPANARGIGCASDRDRDRVLLHRVDPGYRNTPPRDELIMRAVAQRISPKSEYYKLLLAAAPSGRQQISATGQEGHQP
jgi:hypothetical protein